MGERGSDKIGDSATVATATKPLERTFASFYDEVRQSALKDAEWDFATKNGVLREAPTTDWYKQSHDWTDRWDYVYQPPADLLHFFRFVDDSPQLGLVTDYARKKLPITYVKSTIAGTSGVYPWTAAAETRIFQGSVLGTIRDESGVDGTFKDTPGSLLLGKYAFGLYPVGGSTLLMSGNYLSFSTSIDVTTTTNDEFYFAGAVYPSSITLEYARWADNQEDWTNHILTNRQDAQAVYAIDVTNPSDWPEEFQLAVAGEMALRGAVVHAKNSRTIQLLDQQALAAKSKAISHLTSDEGSIYGGQLSGAELARLR